MTVNPEEYLRGGRYEITGVIGRGAMGQVWRAHDPLLGRDVAIKVMAPQLAENRGGMARHEAMIGARVKHPGITAVYDFVNEGPGFIVMEFLEGEDLAAVLRSSPNGLPVAVAVDYTVQVAEALDAVHKKDVVHRDLKPTNLIVQEDGRRRGRIKICDFGVASPLHSQGRHRVGTMEYMSPEQWAGRATPRSDLYSLACVLYQMLTGQPPFGIAGRDVSEAELEARHREVPPSRPHGAHPIPPGLSDLLIDRLLAKDPARRPPSAEDFATALRPWIDYPFGERHKTITSTRIDHQSGPSTAILSESDIARLLRTTLTPWDRSVRAVSWLLFLTMAMLSGGIGLDNWEPASRLYVLIPLACCTLPGALATLYTRSARVRIAVLGLGCLALTVAGAILYAMDVGPPPIVSWATLLAWLSGMLVTSGILPKPRQGPYWQRSALRTAARRTGRSA
jgi:serine/threonine protein kinase